MDLRRLAWSAPHECEPFAIWRETRRQVSCAHRQWPRRVAAVARHNPEAGVVVVSLLIHDDADVDNLAGVWRHLRIGDPDKFEQVVLADDAPLLSREWTARQHQHRHDERKDSSNCHGGILPLRGDQLETESFGGAGLATVSSG